MTRLTTYILLLTTLLAFPAYSHAQDEKVVFALFSRGWPPFEMSEGRKVRGASVDIFKAVMSEEFDTSVEPLPKPRTPLYSQAKPVYTRLEAREWMPKGHTFWWSDPVLKINEALYSSVATPVEYKGQKSLEGKIIGCVRNYTYPKIEPLFATEKATRYDVNKDVLLLRMVKAGRVDAVVMDDLTAKWLIQNNEDLNPEEFHVAARPVDSVDVRFVFNRVKGWDKYLPKINARIKEMRSNGKLDEILSKYR